MKKKKNENEMFKLSDDQVEQVTGGAGSGGLVTDGGGEDPTTPECPKCGMAGMEYVKPTGKTRKGSWLGIIDDKQYYCKKCGTYFWDWGDND